MKILIVSQYFWPENFRINDLVLDLKEKGHEVTVLTGIPNYPEGSYFDGYGLFRRRKEDFHGVSVLRVPLLSRGRSKSVRLALNYLSFAFFASLLGPFYCRGNYDAVFVCQLSPVTVGIPAIILKKLKKAPMFFWILDLWPESLSATGAIRSPLILRLVGEMVRLIYAQCDRILISSKGFLKQVTSMGFPEKRVFYFPNWAEDVYWGKPDLTRLSDLPALPDGFKVVFAGNIGAAQSFPTILAAAERLKHVPDVHWLIAGDGRMAGWVREQVAARGLEGCVHLLGRHSPETIVSLFSQADVLLVTLRAEPAFALTVPGKVQSYLTCSKPVIASLDGEGAALIQEAGAGIACPADSPEALADAVSALREMSPEKRSDLGARGRKFCEENFVRAKLLGKLDAWLKEEAGDSGPGKL